MLDRSLEAGINLVDTADVYGLPVNKGWTEEILGRWLAQGGGRREATVLASKVYNWMENRQVRPEINKDTRSLSKYKIVAHCEASLRRLGTDRIDLYQLHHIDRNCPQEEIWEAMEMLQGQGKVLYVGASNYAGWDIATACLTARARNRCGLVSEQSIYHLANRFLELEVLPACQHFGVGLLPYSPLGGGLLGGVLGDLATGNRRVAPGMAERIARHRGQLEAWENWCAALGQPPGTVALAWLLHQPGVTAPILGPRTLGQLEEAVRALELELEQSQLDALDAIWPGYKSAPEHYAW